METATIEEYLTAEQAANFLQVSSAAIQKWARSGELKGYRAGNLWRFKRADLNAFLNRENVEAAEKVAA